MPPMAANAGNAIFCGLFKSPTTTSRFNSKPTNKKKMAIKPSFIHNSSGLFISNLSIATVKFSVKSCSYSQLNGELATINAKAAANISIKPLAASIFINRRKDPSMIILKNMISTAY